MRTTKTDDPRYYFGKCPECHREWQFIDWGCALHQLRCSVPSVPELWAKAIESAKAS